MTIKARERERERERERVVVVIDNVEYNHSFYYHTLDLPVRIVIGLSSDEYNFSLIRRRVVLLMVAVEVWAYLA